MSLESRHPGFELIEARLGKKLRVVDTIDSFASSITIVADEDGKQYVAKTGVASYEKLTPNRLVYMYRVLKGTPAEIIDVYGQTCLMKYAECGEVIGRPLPAQDIVDVFHSASFEFSDFVTCSFDNAEEHVSRMFQESIDKQVTRVRKWGRDWLLEIDSSPDFRRTVQHGDLLDKNLLVSKGRGIIPLDPLPLETVWFWDLARYVAWVRDESFSSRVEYIHEIRQCIDLPDVFETCVAAFLAIEFCQPFADSSCRYRNNAMKDLFLLAPMDVGLDALIVSYDVIVNGIE